MTIPQAISALRWAVEQAEELLGVHTGGPEEQEYRERLRMARLALTTLERLPSANNKLLDFARKVEPDLANIAFNNRPHSQVYRDLYDACVEIRDVIYRNEQ